MGVATHRSTRLEEGTFSASLPQVHCCLCAVRRGQSGVGRGAGAAAGVGRADPVAGDHRREGVDLDAAGQSGRGEPGPEAGGCDRRDVRGRGQHRGSGRVARGWDADPVRRGLRAVHPRDPWQIVTPPLICPTPFRSGVQLWRMAMSELDDFVTSMLARQTDAERALVGGDPEPRLAITSRQEPVTVFGAKVPLRRALHAARHPRLPPGRRRMEDRPPTRRLRPGRSDPSRHARGNGLAPDLCATLLPLPLIVHVAAAASRAAAPSLRDACGTFNPPAATRRAASTREPAGTGHRGERTGRLREATSRRR